MVALIGRRIPTTGIQGAQAGGLGNVFSTIAGQLADPLTPEIRRQQLLGLNQKYQGTEALANAWANGDVNAPSAIAAAVRAGRSPQDLGGFNLFDVAQRYDLNSPEYARAYASVPGLNWRSSAPGAREQQAAELANLRERTAAELANRLTIENNKLVPVPNPEGGAFPVYGRAGEAVGQVIPPSSTTIKNQSFWDPNTRQVYQSQDNGLTVQIGQNRVPVAGTGLQPVSNEQAVAQTQDVLTQKSLTPLPAAPSQPSRAAAAAEMTSGPTAPLKHEANVLAGLFGFGEVFPQTNEARNYLTNLVNTTRNTLMAAPGRISVQAQKWAAEPFPQPGWLGMTGINAEEQKNNVYRTIAHLRDTYETVRQEALDPNLPPAERQRYAAYLHSLQNTIHMWEAPAAATETAAPTPATSGAQAAPAQNPVRVETPEDAAKLPPGTRYVTPDGQMFDR